MPVHSCVDYDFPTSRRNWHGLALIGEAPGAEEAKQGHPFVGRSGQLLDKVLAEAGINRKNCLVANVFRSQPPRNKVDHFFLSAKQSKDQNIDIEYKFGKFGSLWCRSEFVSDLVYLQATLQKLKPAAIVTLGRTPLWALTGQGELMTKVGHWQSSILIPGAKVMPTYHPSFILRGNWGLQGNWMKHLIEANQRVG